MGQITEADLDQYPAIRRVMDAVRGDVWLHPPNPTVVWKAEVSGNVFEPTEDDRAYGRLSATGMTRESALDHLNTLIERVVDRVE